MRIIHSAKVVSCFITIFFVACVHVASAHTDLAASVPAAKSHAQSSPEALELTFGDAVRLMRLTLTDSGGGSVPLDFSPSVEATTHHSCPLPELAEGRYTVRWSAMAADGHNMTGRFIFYIDSHSVDSAVAQEGKAL